MARVRRVSRLVAVLMCATAGLLLLGRLSLNRHSRSCRHAHRQGNSTWRTIATGVPRAVCSFQGMPLLLIAALSLFASFAASEGHTGAVPAGRGPAGQPTATGQLLVKFREDTAEHTIEGLIAEYGATVEGEIQGIKVRRLALPSSASAEATLNVLQRNPHVQYAEPNYVGAPLDTTPNDSLYGEQWGLQKVRAPAAWSTATGSASIVVAVIDTGVNASHPDLAGKVMAGYDFANNDSDPTDDYGPSGHGSKVAGIIGAASNNGVGIAAIAWESPILPVKVCDSAGQCNASDAANGIVYAVDKGAKVINLSLAWEAPSATLEDAINYAWGRGVVVVAAAGNNGSNPETNQVVYPAAYANVVAVGATGEDDPFFGSDQRASFSSHGPELDMVAPGTRIYSTDYSGGYTSGNGTSYAAPHVAGAAALLWAYGAPSNSAVVNALYQGALDINDLTHYGSAPGWDEYYGWGRLDIYRSLLVLDDTPSPTPTPTPTLTPTPIPTPTTPTPTPRPTPSLHISDLDGTSQKIKGEPYWQATAYVEAENQLDQPEANVGVVGLWSDGKTSTCFTEADGRCHTSSSSLHMKTASIGFTVTSLVADGAAYQPTANHDPDVPPDSDGASITVYKP